MQSGCVHSSHCRTDKKHDQSVPPKEMLILKIVEQELLYTQYACAYIPPPRLRSVVEQMFLCFLNFIANPLQYEP